MAVEEESSCYDRFVAGRAKKIRGPARMGLVVVNRGMVDNVQSQVDTSLAAPMASSETIYCNKYKF